MGADLPNTGFLLAATLMPFFTAEWEGVGDLKGSCSLADMTCDNW